jgi:phage-related protein
VLLRRLQSGETLGMPHSRPLPSIGPRCHELRIRDEDGNWRVVYRLDSDAVLIAEVFAKTSQQTPKSIIDTCQQRLSLYDKAVKAVRKEQTKQATLKKRGNP